jgi:hypothetical protein
MQFASSKVIDPLCILSRNDARNYFPAWLGTPNNLRILSSLSSPSVPGSLVNTGVAEPASLKMPLVPRYGHNIAKPLQSDERTAIVSYQQTLSASPQQTVTLSAPLRLTAHGERCLRLAKEVSPKTALTPRISTETGVCSCWEQTHESEHVFIYRETNQHTYAQGQLATREPYHMQPNPRARVCSKHFPMAQDFV